MIPFYHSMNFVPFVLRCDVRKKLRNAVRAIVVCLRSMVDGAMAMVDGAMAMVDGR